MASIDLKDAYYSIPVANGDRKYLMFEWQGSYYQFTCLPNGLSCASRLFTKILKPVYAHLRMQGHTCMEHIDDSLLIAPNYEDCMCNINATVELFTKLGFVVHPDKSVFTPTQVIEFLGFILNSLTMLVTLSPTKAAKVHDACQSLLNSKHVTIRDVAHVIGLLVSSFPAVQYGELYYRRLEINNINALKANQGNYDASMCLSEGSRTELLWWTRNITHSCPSLITTKPDLVLTTDASLLGWGAVSNGEETGGQWNLEEKNFHINFLEMKAVMLGLQALCKDENSVHICLRSDNTTTVSYINSMRGIKSEICNAMALQIWEWCIARKIWISARHIPGSQNVQADEASREFKDSVEWALNMEIFQDILTRWGPFDIDVCVTA